MANCVLINCGQLMVLYWLIPGVVNSAQLMVLYWLIPGAIVIQEWIIVVHNGKWCVRLVSDG